MNDFPQPNYPGRLYVLSYKMKTSELWIYSLLVVEDLLDLRIYFFSTL
jgi:hypothetical protein